MVIRLRYSDLTNAASQADGLRNELNGYADRLTTNVRNRMNNARGGGASGRLGNAVWSTNQKISELRTRANNANTLATRIRNLESTARNADGQVVNRFNPPPRSILSRIGRFVGAAARGMFGVARGVLGGLAALLPPGMRALGAFITGVLRTVASGIANVARRIADWYRSGGFSNLLRTIGRIVLVVAAIALVIVVVAVAAKAVLAIAKFMAKKALKKAIAKAAKKKAAKAAKAAAKKSVAKKTPGKIKKAISSYKKWKKGKSKSAKAYKTFKTAKNTKEISDLILEVGFGRKSTDLLRMIPPKGGFFCTVAGTIDMGSRAIGIVTLPWSIMTTTPTSAFGVITTGLSTVNTVRSEAGLCLANFRRDGNNITNWAKESKTMSNLTGTKAFKAPPLHVALGNITTNINSNINRLRDFNVVVQPITINVPRVQPFAINTTQFNLTTNFTALKAA